MISDMRIKGPLAQYRERLFLGERYLLPACSGLVTRVLFGFPGPMLTALGPWRVVVSLLRTTL